MQNSKKSNLSRRGFVGLMGLTGVTAMAGMAGCGSSSTTVDMNTTGAKIADGLSKMTWGDVLEEAKGQTVTFCAWDTDVMVKAWWDHLAEYAKENFDIEIAYVPDDAANEQKILTDIENGGDATIDMFWGMGSSMSQYIAKDGLYQEEWLKALPNYQYLDEEDQRVTFDGTQNSNAAESPFQTLNPSLVYSKDKWSDDLAWDASENGVNGLFHNFTELAQWVQKYPGKFTYMDLNGAGTFHAKCFLRAILAELTDDGNGGWKAVYDEGDDEATRQKKIKENNEAWYEWLQSDEASEDAFHTKAAYVWKYLNDIKPYLLQGDDGPLYAADAATMMGYVMSGDLACTFTTCTSISSRIEDNPSSYMDNPQIYMLQTSIGIWDYIVVTQNSKNKAAALVLANAMLDPEQQALAFQTTGNGYNVSYNKLSSDQQKTFDEVFNGFTEGTSPSAEEIEARSYADITGAVNAWVVTGWDKNVNKAK